jgi:hypothetical protein
MGLEPNELSLDYKQELYGNLNHVSISHCNKASDITFASIEVMVSSVNHNETIDLCLLLTVYTCSSHCPISRSISLIRAEYNYRVSHGYSLSVISHVTDYGNKVTSTNRIT